MTPPLEAERGPVVVRVANCQSVSAGPAKAKAIYRRALTKPGRYGKPHVVLGSECADFDAERLAEELGWEAIQYGRGQGRVDVAKAGSALAWNTRTGRQVGRERLLVGSKAGEGIRTRYVVQAKLRINGHKATFGAGHAPPDRAPRAQATWLDRARKRRGVLGADFNTWPKTLGRRFTGRKVRGFHVLSLLVPMRIPCSKAAAVDIGGDHQAVDVVLWPHTKEKKNR